MIPARQILDWLDAKDRRDMALAAALTGAVALWRIGPAQALPFALAGAVSLGIFRIDGRHRLIPDLLNLTLAAVGLVSLALSIPPDLSRLACAALLWLVTELLRRISLRSGGRRLFGGGDVKLIAAAALWLSPLQMPSYLFAAALSGLAEAGWAALRPGGTRPHVIAFGRHLAPWLCLFALAGPDLHI